MSIGKKLTVEVNTWGEGETPTERVVWCSEHMSSFALSNTGWQSEEHHRSHGVLSVKLGEAAYHAQAVATCLTCLGISFIAWVN